MSYAKGKDLKQQGDCLTHLFIKKIESITNTTSLWTEEGYKIHSGDMFLPKPQEFDKW